MLQAAESMPKVPKAAAGPSSMGPATGLHPAMEQATLGATVVVHGEVSGSQALYVDGRVEGIINFPNHRVTIGRGAVVLAKIEAKEVIVMGTVTGNIECSERVDIRSEAVLTGDVVTQRISIDVGAMVQGSVEIRRSQKSDQVVSTLPAKPEVQAKPPSTAEAQAKPEVPPKAIPPLPAEPQKAAPDTSTTSRPAMRVAGSQVLYQEHKAGSR